MGTCFFGVRYAISRIPAEELKRIGDTDWIGVEWILRRGILLTVAVVLALVPPIRALFERLLGRGVLREPRNHDKLTDEPKRLFEWNL